MKRSLVVAVCLAVALTIVIGPAGADPGGTVPISGSSPEQSFSGTLTVTGFAAADKQLTLEGILNGPINNNGGVAADVSNLPVQLPVDDLTTTCEPPKLTIVVAATSVPIPGFDPIILDSVALIRPIDPTDTSVVEQLCQLGDDLHNGGKRKGKRLAQAVDTLNALGGTWELVPAEAPSAG
jgi:hypothetical protein